MGLPQPKSLSHFRPCSGADLVGRPAIELKNPIGDSSVRVGAAHVHSLAFAVDQLGEHGVRTLKELGRSYLTISKEVTRLMNRIKALYRSWAIPCAGTSVYAPRHRAEWLAKLVEPGVRIRAERLYQQLDVLQSVRQQARHDLLLDFRSKQNFFLDIPFYRTH